MTTNIKNSVVAEGNEVEMDCKTKANPPVVEHNWFYEERLIKTDPLKGIAQRVSLPSINNFIVALVEPQIIFSTTFDTSVERKKLIDFSN